MTEPASSPSPILETSGVTHRYATGRVALSEVSLAIGPGERVGLIGPNGAGKSTLLLNLVGVLRPSSGQILLAGEEVGDTRLAELRQRVGLVFQHPDDMLFTTRVGDDVAFGPRQTGVAGEELTARVADALAAVNAAGLEDRVPHHLSAGEKRAVAIASVLSMNPEVLLLDEPTSDLDPRGRRALHALLEGLGKTLMVASHDLEFVLALCQRVIVLDEGKVVADGDARTLLGDEALMLTHGLERPHSLVPHQHPHEHGPAASGRHPAESAGD